MKSPRTEIKRQSGMIRIARASTKYLLTHDFDYFYCTDLKWNYFIASYCGHAAWLVMILCTYISPPGRIIWFFIRWCRTQKRSKLCASESTQKSKGMCWLLFIDTIDIIRTDCWNDANWPWFHIEFVSKLFSICKPHYLFRINDGKWNTF